MAIERMPMPGECRHRPGAERIEIHGSQRPAITVENGNDVQGIDLLDQLASGPGVPSIPGSDTLTLSPPPARRS